MKTIFSLFCAAAGSSSLDEIQLKFSFKNNHLSGDLGIIESPGYPGYSSSQREYWTIDIRPDEFLRFTFLDFDIENDDGCHFDFLTINDEKFCNDQPSDAFSETTTTGTSTTTGWSTTSMANSFNEENDYVSSYVGHVEYTFKDTRLQFRSDAMFNYRGFQLKWEKLSYCGFKLSNFEGNLDDGEAEFFKARKRIVC
ncbi:Oidioi.mRNA.OKI2018_I69.chr1.g580.t1.cds [Oikopleura dioica]|uniref:Oidioi.mRNA.OKI2018_I69.chr1.g580.t1.cds n=1 Tax=Oikopleura dioica TaxID=34765 RepID=A0ABN7SKA4_OIKDI|nr:Oidioi.mRNA.OKI2018_I69.chr1.g580.t1.cds [Oikopleura dioica]